MWWGLCPHRRGGRINAGRRRRGTGTTPRVPNVAEATSGALPRTLSVAGHVSMGLWERSHFVTCESRASRVPENRGKSADLAALLKVVDSLAVPAGCAER